MRKILNFLPYYLYFLFYLPWILVVSPAHYKGRALIRDVSRKLGFPDRPAEFPISTRPIEQVLPLNFDVQLAYPNSHDASVSTYELIVLNAIIKALHPRLMIEFGTYDGRTAHNFALNAPQARLLTLDFAPRPNLLFDGAPTAKNITLVKGDSTVFDIEPYCGKADFIFVDGGHDEPIATADSLNALKMLAPGGVLVWHDYTQFKGVRGAVDAFRSVCEAPIYQVADTTMAIYLAPRESEVRSSAAESPRLDLALSGT